MKKKILVVDDERKFASALKLRLETRGDYDVRAENTARDVVAAALEFAPDVIVLDIVMSAMDGRKVAAQLRAEPLLKHTPMIFFSAMAAEDASAFSAEGLTFLPKTARVERLERLIEYIEEEIRRPSQGRNTGGTGTIVPEVLNKSVADLEFSARSRKALERLNITTLGELSSRTEDDLLAIANVGMTAVNEFKQQLGRYGLALKGVEPDDRLFIRAIIPEFAPEDEVVAEVVNLIRALNQYHVGGGGSGLTVDDWDIRVRAGEPVEVVP